MLDRDRREALIQQALDRRPVPSDRRSCQPNVAAGAEVDEVPHDGLRGVRLCLGGDLLGGRRRGSGALLRGGLLSGLLKREVTRDGFSGAGLSCGNTLFRQLSSRDGFSGAGFPVGRRCRLGQLVVGADDPAVAVARLDAAQVSGLLQLAQTGPDRIPGLPALGEKLLRVIVEGRAVEALLEP